MVTTRAQSAQGGNKDDGFYETMKFFLAQYKEQKTHLSTPERNDFICEILDFLSCHRCKITENMLKSIKRTINEPLFHKKQYYMEVFGI